MTKHIRIATALVLGALAAAATPASAEPMTLQQIKDLEAKVRQIPDKVMNSTVALLSMKTGSSGSGVIVSKSGIIATAAHVVQGSDKLLAVFPNGKQVNVKVLGANYSKDVALAQITTPGEWKEVVIGDSGKLHAGDWVVALGHSSGFESGRTPPLRFGRVISEGPGNFFTTDCTLIGGDSGGPLFDIDGKLVGINSSIGLSVHNNNHAGIDGLKQDWQRLIVGKQWGVLAPNPFANPEMPAIGVGMAEAYNVTGVIVDKIMRGSPADKAGMKIGDVIIGVDKYAIEGGAELMQVLAKHKEGDKVAMTIQRGANKLNLDLILKRRDQLYSNE